MTVLNTEGLKQIPLRKLKEAFSGSSGHKARQQAIVATAICILRTRISPRRESEGKRRPILAVPHRGERLFSAFRVALEPGSHRQQVTNG